MARIVMKFGGTSMAGIERIRRVAQIVKQQAFPSDPVAAIQAGCAEAERVFLQMVENAANEALKEILHEGIEEIPQGIVDNSGSCAIILLMVGTQCASLTSCRRNVLRGERGRQ